MGLSEQDAARLLRSEGFGEGEEIVVLDTGLNVASKHRIDFIATDAALYLWNGKTLQFRVPYGAIADVDSASDSSGARRAPLHGVSVPPGLPNYFGFVMLGVKDPAGLDALVGYTDVSLSNGRLQDYVSAKARFRTISPPYHVIWDESGKGVTFGVLIEEGVPRISAWVADPGVDEKDPSVRSTIDRYTHSTAGAQDRVSLAIEARLTGNRNPLQLVEGTDEADEDLEGTIGLTGEEHR